MEPAKTESKYERLRKIGIGSYGVVFKCINRHTRQIVAIKRYSENDTDPIIRKIAMREVRMLRQLKHPNLIQLIEVFRRKRRLHLVFDYCELTVLDVIEKYANHCPLNLIRKIIWQLVNGVSYCHSHNCIHRDIKPENILINQSGVVKLCDFGFARNFAYPNEAIQQQQQANSQLERDSRLLGVPFSAKTASQSQSPSTSTSSHKSVGQDPKKNSLEANSQVSGVNSDKENSGVVDEGSRRQAFTEYVATRWYRAPELLVGEVHYDIKIDIWAIGCVTAELMRGEPIWPGKTDLDQLSMIKASLGQLTTSQLYTLIEAKLYDYPDMDRLLNDDHTQPAATEPLESKLPARVGELGIEFVLACLRMDPAERPTSDKLLQHAYIHSARMAQFVKGANGSVSAPVPSSPAAIIGQQQQQLNQQHLPPAAFSSSSSSSDRQQEHQMHQVQHLSSLKSSKFTAASTNNSTSTTSGLGSSPTPTTTTTASAAPFNASGDSNELKWTLMQQNQARTNSQALMSAANASQPAVATNNPQQHRHYQQRKRPPNVLVGGAKTPLAFNSTVASSPSPVRASLVPVSRRQLATTMHGQPQPGGGGQSTSNSSASTSDGRFALGQAATTPLKNPTAANRVSQANADLLLRVSNNNNDHDNNNNNTDKHHQQPQPRLKLSGPGKQQSRSQAKTTSTKRRRNVAATGPSITQLSSSTSPQLIPINSSKLHRELGAPAAGVWP